MEAIAELIGALLGAVLMGAAALLELVFGLAVILIEFLFVALTRGRAEAKERFESRTRGRREKREEKAKREEVDPEVVKARRRRTATVAVVSLAGLAVYMIAWYFYEQVQVRREEATKAQIASLADEFEDRIEKKKAPKPKRGPLKERDAWNRPLELFVDEFPVGDFIVVRSAGRDQETGTVDDLLAIRYAQPGMKKVAGAAAKLGWKLARGRVEKMLNAKKKEEEKEEEKK